LALPNSFLGVGKEAKQNAEILKAFRNASLWDSLGLAYNLRKGKKKGVFNTLT
jgi:hypothetical protein